MKVVMITSGHDENCIALYYANWWNAITQGENYVRRGNRHQKYLMGDAHSSMWRVIAAVIMERGHFGIGFFWRSRNEAPAAGVLTSLYLVYGKAYHNIQFICIIIYFTGYVALAFAIKIF